MPYDKIVIFLIVTISVSLAVDGAAYDDRNEATMRREMNNEATGRNGERYNRQPDDNRSYRPVNGRMENYDQWNTVKSNYYDRQKKTSNGETENQDRGYDWRETNDPPKNRGQGSKRKPGTCNEQPAVIVTSYDGQNVVHNIPQQATSNNGQKGQNGCQEPSSVIYFESISNANGPLNIQTVQTNRYPVKTYIRNINQEPY